MGVIIGEHVVYTVEEGVVYTVGDIRWGTENIQWVYTVGDMSPDFIPWGAYTVGDMFPTVYTMFLTVYDIPWGIYRGEH